MNRPVRVVLLNGAGSAGKTSIAKALQTITAEPFLHVQLDGFLEMLPEAYQAHPDGIAYETVVTDGTPMVVIKSGRFGQQLLRGMRHAVAAMAAQGNHIILDEVLLGDEKNVYRQLLASFDLVVVGVLASLDVLEARERARGDRLIGLARWQFERVHRGITYDFVVDTSRTSPLECAESIRARFRL
ncbi:chloramphenicol phosphotransferase CPT family protein [Cupriavidus necator]